MDSIVITRQGSVPALKRPESTFTGHVTLESSIPRRGESRLSGGLVDFQPGARSHWHTHPYGQLLIVTAGRGLVQEWGKGLLEIFAGDLVWFPAGVKHWHGAAPDQGMSHYSIQEELNGLASDWMEKVTDEQYSGE